MSQAQTGERTWIDEACRSLRDATGRGAATGPASRTSWKARPGPVRGPLLQELLRVERELRRGAGETPDAEEYLQRFPDDRRRRRRRLRSRNRPEAGRRASRRPPPPMSLLFGLLALQNNFIDRDALLAAFNAWVADKSQSLGQILLDRGALSPARHAVHRDPGPGAPPAARPRPRAQPRRARRRPRRPRPTSK